MKSALGCLFWGGAVIIGLGAVLKIALFDIATVQHNSMAPTILEGERVLIFKRGAPNFGKIAVCEHPEQPGLVIGRIAARDGMLIESVGTELRIDDNAIEFDKQGVTGFYDVGQDEEQTLTWGLEFLIESDPHKIFMPEKPDQRVKRTTVEEGEVYLLGDNRAYFGHDSRGFGVVDQQSCRGTVFMRITPSDWLTDQLAHGYFDLLR